MTWCHKESENVWWKLSSVETLQGVIGEWRREQMENTEELVKWEKLTMENI